MIYATPIPLAFAEAFQVLAQLPEDDFAQLQTSLRELPRFPSQWQVAAALTQSAGDKIDADALAGALISIILQVPEIETSAIQFAEIVSQSPQLELADDERSSFAGRLSSLLTIEAIGSVGKADDITTDHEHVFRSARILTDVRPVFGAAVDAAPEAAVIVAMLRIDHSTHGNSESTYFALDQDDLVALQEVVGRAITKTQSLERFLSAAGLAHYRHQETEE